MSNLIPINQVDDEFYNILKANLRSDYIYDEKISAFISEYLNCRNAPQAAQAVGLSREDGRFLIKQPDVYAAVEALTAKAVTKYSYDAAEIVERTKEIAFFDPADLVTSDGTFIENMNEMPPEARRAIKKLVAKNIFEDDENGVPQYKGKIITYEFWDKTKTLELLAREKDTFKKTTVVEHDISKNAKSYLLASLDRANERALEAPKDSNTIDVTPLEAQSIPKPPGVT